MQDDVLIPLRKRGGVVIAHAVTDGKTDAALGLSALPWFMSADGYALRTGGVSMARMVLGLAKGNPLQADHVDGDRLNNRRSNLRAVTIQDNAQNRGAKAGSTSKYRGVCLAADHPRDRPWRARSGLGGAMHHLGWYATEAEAARAVARWLRENSPLSVEARHAA